MDMERMIEWEFGGYFISRIINGCNVLRQFETTFSDSLLHSQLDDAMLIKNLLVIGKNALCFISNKSRNDDWEKLGSMGSRKRLLTCVAATEFA